MVLYPYEPWETKLWCSAAVQLCLSFQLKKQFFYLFIFFLGGHLMVRIKNAVFFNYILKSNNNVSSGVF